MRTIQLPTSTGQLLDQVFIAYKFTKSIDVQKELATAPAYSDKHRFFETFDKEAELNRLADLADALSSDMADLPACLGRC